MKIKNYTPFKVENKIHTHEDAVASARASLRSEHKHRFNRKFLCLSADGFKPSEFSQINFSSSSLSLTGEINFVKPNVYVQFERSAPKL
jgi:hypothetical protein